MDISSLVNLTSRAWALPILASLNDGIPGRQAPLLTATGASRTAFAQSIDHLISIGLLERNPGYGHPLRRFRLTVLGKALPNWRQDPATVGDGNQIFFGGHGQYRCNRTAQAKPVHRDQGVC